MLVKSTKLSKIKEKNLSKVDTIFLKNGKKEYNYELNYNLDKETPILDIDNVIIAKNIFKKYKDIELIGTDAKNIYIENEENLGGLTINRKTFAKRYFIINDDETDIKNRIEKINIIYENKVCTIDLNENYNYIKINDDRFNKGDIVLYLSNNLGSIEYLIDDKGIIINNKRTHYITNNDIENKVLDMRNIIDYDSLHISESNNSIKKDDIDTIIFNKNVLKNLNKFEKYLYSLNTSNPNIYPKNIRIIDENDMQLIPTDVTYSFEIAKTFINENKRYLYLENNGNDVLIYIDNDDKLIIIEKNKLLNYESIEKAYYKINVEYCWYANKTTNLILIKYKDNTYNIRSFNEVININRFFNLILLMNKDYLDLSDKEYNDIKNNDWVKIFNSENFNNITLEKYKKVYLKYIEPLKYLCSLELSENTINYLSERNYLKPFLDNIINNKESENTKNEIEILKKLSKKYNS